ncbi:MAG: putative calcium/sodium:proton antiporter [Syntrophus sp. PtaU1.Bin208]|nr:MAG: putative calcium/sodium:proton antiporter [Syntrophus sp. PtaU1.Bin208]
MNISIATVWLSLMLCVILIGVAGSRLSRYGDVIADKTGMGGTWIGLILLATVTSLPELMTGISSVTLADTPDIALGNVLGSCVFNLMLITILDFLIRGESVYSRVSQGHILSAGFGIILIGILGFNLLIGTNGWTASLGHVGLYSLVIIVLYAIAMRTVFRYNRAQQKEFLDEVVERYPGLTLREAVGRYALSALVVVATGIWLPFVGSELALVMGWGQSFVGTLFVAMVTCVPEAVVTISALRLGAFDMAISNLLGSNLFNVLIIAIDDIFFVKGALLSHASTLHAVSVLSAVMMSGVVIVGLLYRPQTRLFRSVGWASLFLLSLYLLNSFVLYLYGK